ncbi:MAG: YggU family protein [Pseudomonadales bacterium]|nr:YggU family protein [Pseudomonadales bacterium]
MAHWYQWQGEDLILHCRLQPRASRNEIVGEHGAELKIRITAPPVEGQANARLTAFLATEFGVPKSGVLLESGATGRSKRVRIHAPGRIPAKLKIDRP